jgi:N-acetyl-anhydromuramyl-L-alanine amidase AmpD
MKYKLLVVIHESLITFEEVLELVQSSNIQGTYHSFIRRDGEIIYLEESTKNVNAAMESSFNGEEILGSVDPFAYHICLESPINCPIKAREHLGYTDQQYYSLAWLIASLNPESNRIVKHKDIDTSGTIYDPRSLDILRVKSDIPKFLAHVKPITI